MSISLKQSIIFRRPGRKTCWILFGILLFLLVGAGIYAVMIEPSLLLVRQEQVYLNHWHQEHNGLRVVLISDIHQMKDESALQRLDRIVERTNAEQPDLIFLLGDYIGRRATGSGHASPADVASRLKKLTPRFGTYAVLGNHDWWHSGTQIRLALQRAGITVLENETATVTISGKQLNITGLPDAKTRGFLYRRQEPVRANNSDPTLLLSHSPHYFDEPKMLPYELMFSGHTHGGQIVVPLVGPAILPSIDHSFQYTSGWYESDSRKLFITKGTGTSLLKIRLFAPPEIVSMRLFCADQPISR